ncbi:MAG: PSD1 domain-containing protein [Planctomycetia bacterium]|nr:PSD1 domain-containing protein [Planctomycetia bacterium]
MPSFRIPSLAGLVVPTRAVGALWSVAAILLAVAAIVPARAADPPTPEQIDFFEKKVRPVLAERCWSCHGSKKQESDMRLDSREGLLKGGALGPAAVPGKPEESELVLAIRHDGALKMPPTGKLPQSSIDALTKWVEMGLPWPEKASATAADPEAWKRHWAFQPIRKTPPPAVDRNSPHRDWPQTAIDHFILAGLSENGLSPSPPADRRTLIRRLSFDLLGLPPAPEDVEAFVADASPDAYERLVDRLLASPHYGERWGRHWLDVARYADNKGYVFFEDKSYPWAYTYRDYVVRAMSEDLPYDRFIMEQLAADQVESNDPSRLAAMGFLTVGAHFMNNVHDIYDDRIDVVSRGLMGLTVTCARCHDHKFDPIPQADYYSLYGVFRSSQEPDVPPLLAAPPETPEFKKFSAELEVRYGKLSEFVDRKYTELVATGRSRAAEYLLAAHALRNQPSTEDFMLLTDAGELNPALIVRWRIYLEKTRKAADPVWLPWHRLTDIPEAEFAAAAPKVLEEVLAEGSPQPVNPIIRHALVAKGKPASLTEVAHVYGEALAAVDREWQSLVANIAPATDPTCEQPAALGTIPQPAVAVRGAPQRLADDVKEQLRLVLYGTDAPPNVPQTFGWGFLTLLPDRPAQGEYEKLLKAVEQWLAGGAGSPPRAMVLVDAPQLYDPRVFLRGNPERLGPAVPRQFLSCAQPDRQPFQTGAGRLELARAIVDPKNPLAARVIVNRIWLHHFGAGLVRTPSDFGLRSEPPSHPELLDYLARDLVENGWSLKRLHRQILLSAVYRQASVDRAQARSRDPENRWLWKFTRRRLDFESLRDALVFVSGQADRKLGGRPVGLFGGEIAWRRSLYGFIDRMDVPPMLTTFDFPSPTTTAPQRETTTVPAQALYLMNGSFAQETAARLWQRRDVASLADLPARIVRLHKIVFGREPSATELELAREFLSDNPSVEQQSRYAHALLLANEFQFVD